MDESPPTGRFGGGIFIAAGAIGGVLIGRQFGETSIGLLAGIAVGMVLALIPWLLDRRRH